MNWVPACPTFSGAKRERKTGSFSADFTAAPTSCCRCSSPCHAKRLAGASEIFLPVPDQFPLPDIIP
ncbi:Hypothetical predicted protein [Podarcis lilfordi]|uniref:Uncharacterized protein n=1 Tax=Podarcis lilfordi TaxID=74358 RepID=A0AA35KES4_9SAUR|nr:Hypothetical predicted protein [Podarcis lilfordi]